MTADEPEAPRPSSGDRGGRWSDGLLSTAGPWAAVGGLVLVLLAALTLRAVASLIVPVLFGLLIALVAWPLVVRLERRTGRRAVALASGIAVVLGVVFVAGFVAALSVGQLVVQVPTYEGRLSGALADLRALLAEVGIQADPAAIGAIISPDQAFGFVRPVASAVAEAAGSMIVLAFTMVYALTGGATLRARAAAALGEQHPLLVGVERFGIDLRRYLVVRAQLGIFSAVLSFVLLFVLGVPVPALWAILVFAASFVPTIGTFIAAIPPTLLAYLDGGLGQAAIVVVGYTLINVAQDYVLQPVAMGSQLDLSPLVVFLSIVGWAWVLGPAGALLAIPLTIGLVMLLEAFPSSRPVAALLRHGGEPVSVAAANDEPVAEPAADRDRLG